MVDIAYFRKQIIELQQELAKKDDKIAKLRKEIERLELLLAERQ